MIYAIRCEHFVKFGETGRQTSAQRIATMQTGNPFKLELLAEANWPSLEEQRIHRYLRAQRARGEWFAICERTNIVVIAMHIGLDAWHKLLIDYYPKRLQRAASLFVARA